jgi:exodeoxyribonuclease VII large subunit
MISRGIKLTRMDLSVLEEKMKDLNPLSVLKRGYSITWKLPEKEVLRDASAVKTGDHVEVLLAEGELQCLIEKTRSGS